jgi:hypothetical protein
MLIATTGRYTHSRFFSFSPIDSVILNIFYVSGVWNKTMKMDDWLFLKVVFFLFIRKLIFPS